MAFVLGGGGNLGAMQVGMLRALVEGGLRPDIVVGCSVGALNGAAFAEDPTERGLRRLEELWSGLERERPLEGGGWLPDQVSLARRGVSLRGNEKLREVIEANLVARTFAELLLPFQCVATDVADACEHWFTQGSLVDALLASAALPAVLPPVEIDGVPYIDGGVVNDVPVSRAVELGAETIVVLHVGNYDRPRRELARPLDAVKQAYWISRHHRLQRDLATVPDHVRLVLLPRGDQPDLRYDDFSQSQELLERAYRASASFLHDVGS